jgi:hypothetical protein
MEESSVEFINQNGGYYLLELLSQEPGELGITQELDLELDNRKITIEEYLGHGGCSVVYKGIHKSKASLPFLFHSNH